MKKLIQAAILILVGILIGGGVVYQIKSRPGDTSEPQLSESQSDNCEVDVADSDLKKKLEERTDLTESEIESASSYLKFKRIKESMLPSGSPDYGAELSVSYDQADQAVDTLANLEQKVGRESLSSEEKKRYVEIGTTGGTACEFCCGLTSGNGFARSNGQRQCGCAHNIAFSGLTMWMIENGYSNQEILDEISKWKASFFPKQSLTQRLQQMKEDDPEIKKMLKEFPAFLPQMVGGC